jgi:hypothetical protein
MRTLIVGQKELHNYNRVKDYWNICSPLLSLLVSVATNGFGFYQLAALTNVVTSCRLTSGC